MNNLNSLSNNNDIVSSILSPSKSSFSKTSFSNTESLNNGSNDSSESFFDSIKNISMTTWIMIILILAFLGFNIFVYLAKGTQDFTSFLKPIIEKFWDFFASLTGQVTSVSAEGAKAVVSGTAGVLDTGLTAVQQASTPEPTVPSTTVKSQSVQNTIPPTDLMSKNTLNNKLNTSQKNNSVSDYEADDASSTIQSGPPKSGWCFIGEDRGFRTCGQVGINDTCMSGEIFPSQQICVNPTLRA